MFDIAGKESQFMFSHPELGLDPPIGSDRESGHDKCTEERDNDIPHFVGPTHE